MTGFTEQEFGPTPNSDTNTKANGHAIDHNNGHAVGASPVAGAAAGAGVALTTDPWPELGAAAYHGLAGEVVTTLSPQTEADPVALLLQYLAYFGNAVGRGPHYIVENDRHYPNLFVLLAGETAKARKGIGRPYPARIRHRRSRLGPRLHYGRHEFG